MGVRLLTRACTRLQGCRLHAGPDVGRRAQARRQPMGVSSPGCFPVSPSLPLSKNPREPISSGEGTTRETCSCTDRNQCPRCVSLKRKVPVHATGCPRGASRQYSLRCALSVRREPYHRTERRLGARPVRVGCDAWTDPHADARRDGKGPGGQPGRKAARPAQGPVPAPASPLRAVASVTQSERCPHHRHPRGVSGRAFRSGRAWRAAEHRHAVL